MTYNPLTAADRGATLLDLFRPDWAKTIPTDDRLKMERTSACVIGFLTSDGEGHDADAATADAEYHDALFELYNVACENGRWDREPIRHPEDVPTHMRYVYGEDVAEHFGFTIPVADLGLYDDGDAEDDDAEYERAWLELRNAWISEVKTRTGTYEIRRFYSDLRPVEIIQTGLSLAEAQAHCRREDTHGKGWFDGYALIP